MTPQEIKQLVQQEIKNVQQDARFSISNASYHLHNGIDAPRISYENIINSVVITGSGAPTLSATKGTLYINVIATTTLTRLYINTDGKSTWAYFTASA